MVDEVANCWGETHNFSAPVSNCNSHPKVRDSEVRNPQPDNTALQSWSFRAAESRAVINPRVLQPLPRGCPPRHHPKIPQNDFAIATRRDSVAEDQCHQLRGLHHPTIAGTSRLSSSSYLNKDNLPTLGEKITFRDPGVRANPARGIFSCGRCKRKSTAQALCDSG